MGFREYSLALDGRGDRRLEPLGQLQQLGAGTLRSESHVQKRPGAGSATAAPLRGRWSRAERRATDGLRCTPGFGSDLVPGRDTNPPTPRPSPVPACPTGRARRPADDGVELVPAPRAEHSLGHRPRDRELVDVVQLIGVPGIPSDAAAQHQHRHAVHAGFGDAGERVGEPRAGNNVYAPDGSRRAARVRRP